MCTGDNPDFCTDDANEASDEPTAISPAPVAETETRPIWARRTFLKAAALGAAAAALVSKSPSGLRFGPLPAAANDLSNKPCTAGDVEIVGTGIVLNEPCDCDGTFDAEVQFTVRNNTATERYCVAIHLPDGRDALLVAAPGEPNAGLSIAQGKSGGESFQDTVMVGIIEDFTCGAGTVCFGQEGVTRGKCDPGACATIGWNTNPGAANCTSADQTPPSGQCRHQQICIQARGDTELKCETEACDVLCGEDTTLTLCTSSDADSFGPFAFELVADDPNVIITPVGDPYTQGDSTCQDFTAGPITVDTEFTGTVTDNTGCADSDSVTVTTSAITVEIAVSGEDNCDGNLTLTASAPDFSGCSFTWTVDGQPVLSDPNDPTGATLLYRILDGVCHTVEATATCGGCTGKASESITQCVETSLGCAASPTPAARPERAPSQSAKKRKKGGKGKKRGKGKKKAQHGGQGNGKGAGGKHRK